MFLLKQIAITFIYCNLIKQYGKPFKNKFNYGAVKKIVNPKGETDYDYSLRVIATITKIEDVEEIIEKIKKALEKNLNEFDKADSCILFDPIHGGYFITENEVQITDYHEADKIVGSISLTSFLRAAADWLKFFNTRPYHGENYFLGYMYKLIKN